MVAEKSMGKFLDRPPNFMIVKKQYTGTLENSMPVPLVGAE